MGTSLQSPHVGVVVLDKEECPLTMKNDNWLIPVGRILSTNVKALWCHSVTVAVQVHTAKCPFHHSLLRFLECIIHLGLPSTSRFTYLNCWSIETCILCQVHWKWPWFFQGKVGRKSVLISMLRPPGFLPLASTQTKSGLSCLLIAWPLTHLLTKALVLFVRIFSWIV